MAIGSISGYGNIPTYPVREIPKAQQDISVNEQSNVSNGKITITEHQPQPADIASKEITSQGANTRAELPALDLQDISIGFNKNDDFSYIGKDANIESLDIQKAISDMQKDSLFQEYQYFVGSVIH